MHCIPVKHKEKMVDMYIRIRIFMAREKVFDFPEFNDLDVANNFADIISVI